MSLHLMPTFGRVEHAEINADLARAGAGRRPLVAVHRGTFGGTIVENTAAAVAAAVRRGGDLVEIDVVASTDGQLYCFHTGYEPYHFASPTGGSVVPDLATLPSSEIDELRYRWIDPEQPVERLSTVLRTQPTTLLNLDRAWPHWEHLLPVLATDPRPGRFLVKSPMLDDRLDLLEASDVAFPYMGMVRTLDDVEALLARERLNLVAVEVLAGDPDDPFCQPEVIADLKDRGLLVWANSLNLADGLRRYAGYDDVTSVLSDPVLGWGTMLALGIDIIQTDWPDLLSSHLRDEGLR
ncbi:glycerophosphodiester phosphodiesterase family protein [Aestuariimicrobium soli]|uniref:glycerophosphodiester phosphodiesterase family protein n=1 Tax=Aestuariimicrobium soli TaxID=2035834 RepID=UPI003EB9FC0C